VAVMAKRSAVGHRRGGRRCPHALRHRADLSAHFGRVYAAYGGVFVLLSLLWGWAVDCLAPRSFDVIGAAICLVGMDVIMYWPR
jgi:drug/metabolite transporter superfamily protein YnfA